MKSLALGVLTLVLSGAFLSAQETRPYGPIGIVAVSPAEDSRPTVVRLATELSNVLRTEKKVLIAGEAQPLLAREATDVALVKLAEQLRVNWLAVVSFENKDPQHGVFTLDVIHIDSQKVMSRVSALFGVLRTAGNAVGDDVVRQATRAAHAVTQFVSQFKEVRVILSLLTNPSEAGYTFGSSDRRTTNKDGVDTWEGTRPVGTTTLRVMKAGYSDVALDIAIPASTQVSYVALTEVVTLKPKP